MSFLEYMVSHLQYFDGSQMFGLFRVILWALVNLISSLCSAAEGIYNHIFSLVGVIYNDNVVRFLQGWMGFIWIPIAISVLYLGYSLIMGDAAEGNMRAKTFARNVCLFILIVVGVPYLFIGHADTDSASLFVNSNVTSYTPESSVSSNSGILEFFSDDSGQGIINGVSSMARGSSDNTTKTQALIAGNLIDLKTVYMDTLYLHNNGTNMATTSWMDYLESGQIRKNQFYKRGTTSVVNGSGILETNITEKISVDNLKKEDFGDGDEGESFHISDVLVSSYEYGAFFSNNDSYFDSTVLRELLTSYGYDSDNLSPQFITGLFSYLPETEADKTVVKRWLFSTKHGGITRMFGSDGKVVGVTYSNDGKTDQFFDFINPYPFRYRVEWGALFIELIAAAIVLFLTSYKIARIIYEITVNQFLVLFFGAADLSSGQRTKEILKSLFGLVLSLFFAVVMVEFYFIIAEAVNHITFIPNDGSNSNNWMRALVQLFVAMAAIKGPAVLERVLGIEGGVSGAWRDIGTATRPARNTAKRAASAAAKGLAVGALAGSYYGATKLRGAAAQREANKNGNQRRVTKRSSAFDKSRSETAGIDGQFSAISKKNKVRSDEKLTRGANRGKQAATGQFTAQSNDIAAKVKDGDKKSAVRENELIANRYRGNIQNAALAEQARARANGITMSDKDALKKAYENHGFSSSQADSLAHRDVSSGGYSEKKEKFDNSISAQAKQRYEANPTEYKNMSEAYRASASEHYKALGFDDATANNLAKETANRVLVDDMQTVVRQNAQSALSRATAAELSSYVDKSGAPLPREEIERQYLTNSATELLSSSSSVGYTGNIDDAVSQMLSQGTLREGVQRGRIANNIQRERAEVNTRAAALGGEQLGPGAKAAATMTVGYFGERMMETLHDSGYKVGSRKKERRTLNRTVKQGEKAKKKR